MHQGWTPGTLDAGKKDGTVGTVEGDPTHSIA